MTWALQARPREPIASERLCDTAVLGQPFLKRFALCCRIVVCLFCLSIILMYCGRTIGWIKMKLDVQVGINHGHIVSDGDQRPLPQRGAGPNFRLIYGWMDQDATCRKVGLDPSDIVLHRDPAPHPQKGDRAPHPLNFRPTHIVAERLDGSRCYLVWRQASAQATLC